MDKESIGNTLLSKFNDGDRPIRIRIEQTVNGEGKKRWEEGFLHPESWPFRKSEESIGIGTKVEGMAGTLYPTTAHFLVDQLLEIWIVNEDGPDIPIFRRV